MGAHPILTSGGTSDQGIHETKTSARHPVGTRACLPDGRVYYYSKCGSGAALSPGQLAMAEVIPSTRANLVTAAAAAAQDSRVSVTLGALLASANDYAEGYLHVNDVAGEGHTYKIKDHLAIASAGTGWFNLYDPVVVALTTSSQTTLQKNPWADVVIAAAGHVHQPVGVPPVDVAASAYFWMQTWGSCAGWDDAATAIGASLQSGADAAGGQFEVNDGAAGYLGIQLYTGVATEYYPKFLTIAP